MTIILKQKYVIIAILQLFRLQRRSEMLMLNSKVPIVKLRNNPMMIMFFDFQIHYNFLFRHSLKIEIGKYLNLQIEETRTALYLHSENNSISVTQVEGESGNSYITTFIYQNMHNEMSFKLTAKLWIASMLM